MSRLNILNRNLKSHLKSKKKKKKSHIKKILILDLEVEGIPTRVSENV